MITTCEKQHLNVFIDNWKNELSRERARRGNGQNKLRTYRTYKSSFETETYVKVLMPFAWRSSIAKLRTGVAPLRLETGRYEGLAVNQRTCFNCNENVKSEQHVLLKCPLYEEKTRLKKDGRRAIKGLVKIKKNCLKVVKAMSF